MQNRYAVPRKSCPSLCRRSAQRSINRQARLRERNLLRAEKPLREAKAKGLQAVTVVKAEMRVP
jgi:hypothetical protein